jgi:peptidoglycan/LPS O-acetylase OafA/YrhL
MFIISFKKKRTIRIIPAYVIVAFLLISFTGCGKAAKKINNLLSDSSVLAKSAQTSALTSFI